MNVTQELVHTIVALMAPVQMLMARMIAHVTQDILVMALPVTVSILPQHDYNFVILGRAEIKMQIHNSIF